MPYSISRAIWSVGGSSLYFYLRSLVKSRKRSLSQAGQDFWVFAEAFDGKRGGTFVEIGSADGISMNNTFLLEKRYGWSGLCIEANPEYFYGLQRVRTATCLNLCIDAKEGAVQFLARELGGGIVGPDTDNHEIRVLSAAPGMISLRTRSLGSVLDEHRVGRLTDYLSVDVEGAEDRVLGEFPFHEYRFNCITVERPKKALSETLQKNGYILVRTMPGSDSFFIHESFRESYVQNIESFWAKNSQ